MWFSRPGHRLLLAGVPFLSDAAQVTSDDRRSWRLRQRDGAAHEQCVGEGEEFAGSRSGVVDSCPV